MRARRWPSLLAGAALWIPAAVSAATPSVGGLGEVRSEGKVEVKSKVSVPIRRIAVQEGDRVSAGQLIVEMDNDVQAAQVEAAKAEVERAHSALARAELQLGIASREYERNRKVPDLITARELDQSRDAVAQAEADVRARGDEWVKAKAQLVVAQASYGETLIRAPSDGLVSRVYLRAGSTPKLAETTILDVLTLDRLYVEVALPLPYLHAVRVGAPVKVTVEDDHQAIRTVTVGTVAYVYPEVDPTTRMFRIKVRVDRQDFRVLPGMLARISVPAAAGAAPAR